MVDNDNFIDDIIFELNNNTTKTNAKTNANAKTAKRDAKSDMTPINSDVPADVASATNTSFWTWIKHVGILGVIIVVVSSPTIQQSLQSVVHVTFVGDSIQSASMRVLAGLLLYVLIYVLLCVVLLLWNHLNRKEWNRT